MGEPARHQREAILGILKRQEDSGQHISEAEIGREIGIDAPRVASMLRDMTAEGAVLRTAGGDYELTPATAGAVQARPHPREPRQ